MDKGKRVGEMREKGRGGKREWKEGGKGREKVLYLLEASEISTFSFQDI